MLLDVEVEGDYIGVDRTGSLAVANTGGGIYLENNATKNEIGGTSLNSKNVISGNGENGIYIDSTSSANTIASNYIGTNAQGDASVPNMKNGILVSSANNIIGGAPSDRNLISGNDQNGLAIEGSSAVDNSVISDVIGTDIEISNPLGNGHNGILYL